MCNKLLKTDRKLMTYEASRRCAQPKKQLVVIMRFFIKVVETLVNKDNKGQEERDQDTPGPHREVQQARRRPAAAALVHPLRRL